MDDARLAGAIEAAEAFADRLLTTDDLDCARQRFARVLRTYRARHGESPPRFAAEAAHATTEMVVMMTAMEVGLSVLDHESSDYESNLERERAAQTALIRDIFGNPYQPVTFVPSWRTEAVVALARTMYDARDFAPMPVLADALDDAGCDQPDILAHCRGPGLHVRGCWVVDLVLGRG